MLTAAIAERNLRVPDNPPSASAGPPQISRLWRRLWRGGSLFMRPAQVRRVVLGLGWVACAFWPAGVRRGVGWACRPSRMAWRPNSKVLSGAAPEPAAAAGWQAGWSRGLVGGGGARGDLRGVLAGFGHVVAYQLFGFPAIAAELPGERDRRG